VGAKYRLVSELGRGGMGTVWHARHLRLNCPIALKLIDPIVAMGPLALQRFLREARIAAALRGPHVVHILDYGVDGDIPYIAMEMLDGESLARRLQRDGRLSTHETARVIRHVSRALGRAHGAGVVHRDLKPENIFVIPNGDEALIKVLDFGIAKVKTTALHGSASMMTREGALMGTPYFMSPEQAEGLRSVDFRADIWALGVVAFECLLGALPFKGDNVAHVILAICRDAVPVPSEMGPVPVGFDAWFARACARDPSHRFESAKQAADEFENLEYDTAAGAPSRERMAFATSHLTALEPRDATARPLASSRPRRASPLDGMRARIAVGVLGGALLVSVGAVGVGKYGVQGPRAESVSSPLRPEPVVAETEHPTHPALPPEPSTSTADAREHPRGPAETGSARDENEPGLGSPTNVRPASESLESNTTTMKRPSKRSSSRRSKSNLRTRAKPPVIDLGI
jgi:eukaryotic-like serine/threonine-protein kinase